MNRIARNFEAAASSYDEAALMQGEVARRLVRWAGSHALHVQSVLDVGCGTGLVTECAYQQWPDAAFDAVDPSPSMLQQAQVKVPSVRPLTGDAMALPVSRKYDLILSSMMLHWLPDPAAVLRSWQSHLDPCGQLFVALLGEGSFSEWRQLCQQFDTEDGLWSMPPLDFIKNVTAREQHPLTLTYPSAHDFLGRLKKTGAATPRASHRPVRAGKMRRILAAAPVPFHITYQVIYIRMSSQGIS